MAITLHQGDRPLKLRKSIKHECFSYNYHIYKHCRFIAEISYRKDTIKRGSGILKVEREEHYYHIYINEKMHCLFV